MNCFKWIIFEIQTAISYYAIAAAVCYNISKHSVHTNIQHNIYNYNFNKHYGFAWVKWTTIRYIYGHLALFLKLESLSPHGGLIAWKRAISTIPTLYFKKKASHMVWNNTYIQNWASSSLDALYHLYLPMCNRGQEELHK